VQWRSGYVVAGGGLVVLLGVLVASVIWMSDSSKQRVVQPNPTPATSSPMAAEPPPLPATTTELPPPTAPPAEAISPSQVTAETMAPAPPRHRRLHELFPNLFPN